MKRREFIKLTAGFAAAAAASAPLSMASSQGRTVFKASDVQPAGYPTVAATESILDDNDVRAQGSPDMLKIWQAKGSSH